MSENFGKYQETITQLSMNQRTGKSLIEDDKKLYNFDAIAEALTSNDKKPASVDAIAFTQTGIVLIEYKTGFNNKILSGKIEKKQLQCPYDEKEVKICEEYGKLIRKTARLEKKELLDSIRSKAVESYVLLEKEIISNCEKVDYKVFFWAIIDEPKDQLEDIGLELGKMKKKSNNSISVLKQSLSKFQRRKNYYYDAIEVMTAADFKRRIKTLMI